jgi:hypothetical protein
MMHISPASPDNEAIRCILAELVNQRKLTAWALIISGLTLLAAIAAVIVTVLKG